MRTYIGLHVKCCCLLRLPALGLDIVLAWVSRALVARFAQVDRCGSIANFRLRLPRISLFWVEAATSSSTTSLIHLKVRCILLIILLGSLGVAVGNPMHGGTD